MIKTKLLRLRSWLSRLSFRTGVVVLLLCVPCYVLAFTLPFLFADNAVKGAVWAGCFGLAKTFQYAGLTILGAEGWKRLKGWMKRRRAGR